MKTYLLGLIVVLLLIVGCTTQEEPIVTGKVTAPTPAPVSDDSKEAAASTVEHEVYLKQTVDRSGDIESEVLFPSTMDARVGDTVKLHFMLEEPKFITIDEIGFAELVQYDTIEFVVKEAGIHSIICQDCEDTKETQLRVE